MTTSELDEAGTTFLYYARIYLDVNALGPDWCGHFVRETMGLRDGGKRDLFVKGLAAAVSGIAITARDYELATGWAFDSEEQYRAHLREIWEAFKFEFSPQELIVEGS